jgi:hypothetical protein
LRNSMLHGLRAWLAAVHYGDSRPPVSNTIDFVCSRRGPADAHFRLVLNDRL